MTDEIGTGEALSNVRHLFLTDRKEDPQRRAFEEYRDAFNENSVRPCLASARKLVAAWDSFAEAMDLGPGAYDIVLLPGAWVCEPSNDEPF